MKIGMLVNNLDVSGGYQKLVLRLSLRLVRAGHEVTIYTLSADASSCYPELIAQVHVVMPDGGTIGARRVSAYPPLQMAARFAALSDLIDPSLNWLVIHDDLSLYALARLRQRRSLHVTWMLNNQLPANLLSLRPAARQWRSPGLLAAAARSVLLLRRAVRSIDDFAVYDRANAELVQKELGRDATVVYAGADVEEFRAVARQREERTSGGLKLLSVGVLFPHRRYEDTIRAVRILCDDGVAAALTIVGLSGYSPGYAETLRELVSTLGVAEAVEFRDAVSASELAALYQDADAFVFVNDGFTWGISVFEAVAAEVPVVITKNVGAADLIQGDRHGWIVEPRAPEAVARALRRIAADRDEARHRAERAADELLPLVSWAAYTRRMLALAGDLP
jgi:glycosyltransferase involved in cell wall biosynthesis